MATNTKKQRDLEHYGKLIKRNVSQNKKRDNKNDDAVYDGKGGNQNG